MNKQHIIELSGQLKDMARDLTFLGRPHYPLKDLRLLFPQHTSFINCLEDVSIPFSVNVGEKKKASDQFAKDLTIADIPYQLKKIFIQRMQDYQTLLSMMENFGTPIFYENCLKLYGTSHKLIQNNSFLYFIEEIPKYCNQDDGEIRLKGEDARKYLKEKLLETFEEKDFEVRPSSSLLSDSSAGRKTLKLNPHKEYTKGQLDIFLVHEGWVHLGSSLNGAYQKDHSWLSTWAPRTTHLQEGLAIITEIITGCMTLERWNKIVLRHFAVSMAERGSSITDVYEYLRQHGLDDLDSFKLALRVFRGVPLEGGMAFTKELLYLHGTVELLSHLHLYKTDLKTLWIGKISFEEHIMILDHWEKISPTLKYFPKQLEENRPLERLRKLKELSFSLFNHKFL